MTSTTKEELEIFVENLRNVGFIQVDEALKNLRQAFSTSSKQIEIALKAFKDFENTTVAKPKSSQPWYRQKQRY